MRKRQGTKISLRGCPLAIAAALALSSPAHAVQFDWGDWSGSWDNTISYGISWRGEDPDPALIGIGNGGTAPAILTDDGNLNFEKGDIFSNIIKGTSEFEISNGQFGGFARIKYWYDFELMKGDRPHGHSPNNYVVGETLDDADFDKWARFSGLRLLDLFVYGSFDLGNMPLDVRVGRQVVNWGEATFIQGVNVLNPIDVSAFRRPGAEIKEGLLPVALIYGNLGLGGGWSLEAFYQFQWEETVIDGCGTYFSDVDFAASGCNQLLAPDIGVPEFVLQNINNVRKDPFVNEASDSGQFGVAVRNYVDAIDTEFGLYYQRLHNRTPVLNVRYNLQAALDGSIFLNGLGGGPFPSYYQVEYPEDIDIYGVSFATNVGTVALSGEVSYKKDLPVGVNGTTELLGGLGVLASQGAACGTPVEYASYGQFGARACQAFFSFATTGDGLAQGWDRFDVTQAQATAIYFWEQGLGAQRVSLVGEVAWIGVSDLPDISVMPYGRNPSFGPPVNLGGVNDDGFVTSNSWGYRFRASANYPNVFAGVELTPSIAWAHDVKGTSPTPSFQDGRKAFSVALGANYLTKYRGSIAYTWFSGGVANTQSDRDFFSFTVSMDF
ncbi:MAG: DUF1302 domain-containing protein [Xanthomonadales bacterium]|nr:DUF1302 domain-containing protein [Xanthomonadales bacterium]